MYYYDFGKRENDIFYLQEMLRTLYLSYGAPFLSVAPDGKFDSGTMAALKVFQKEKGLPATGVCDLVTWEALNSEYENCLKKFGKRVCISPFPDGKNTVIRTGDRGDLVIIIQIMLDELRVIYDSYGYIPVNGRYGKAEEAAVKEIQRISGFPETGEVDGLTWDLLAEKYNKLII